MINTVGGQYPREAFELAKQFLVQRDKTWKQEAFNQEVMLEDLLKEAMQRS